MGHAQANDDTHYPELLTDIAEQIALRLKTHGLDDEAARVAAFEIAEHVRGHFAGELIYIPKGRAFEANELHKKIWDRFKGDNHADLAREFGMAEQSIYRVIKFMRAREMRRTQLSLIE